MIINLLKESLLSIYLHQDTSEYKILFRKSKLLGKQRQIRGSEGEPLRPHKIIDAATHPTGKKSFSRVLKYLVLISVEI